MELFNNANSIKSACLVCLSVNSKLIDVFGEDENNIIISEIISKHLWFDCNSSERSVICISCLTVLKNFNEFYNKILLVHSQTERLNVKLLKTEIQEDVECPNNIQNRTESTNPLTNLSTKLSLKSENLNLNVDHEDTNHWVENDEDSLSVTHSHNDFFDNGSFLVKGDFSKFDFESADSSANNIILEDNLNKTSNQKTHLDDKIENDSITSTRRSLRSNVLSRGKTDFHKNEKKYVFIQENLSDSNVTNMQQNIPEGTIKYQEEQSECYDGDPFKMQLYIKDNKNNEITKVKKIKIKKNKVKNTTKTPSKLSKADEFNKISNMNPEKMALEDEQIRSVVSMKCDLCDFIFNIFRDCKSHYRTAHNVTGYLKCCGSKILKRARVVQHIQRHINPNGSTCNVCNKNFCHQAGLKLHMDLKHNSEIAKPWACDKCPKTFAKSHLLHSHKLQHATEKPYLCPNTGCDKAFVHNSILQNHIRSVHEGAYVHVCDICAKEFRSKGSYETHCKLVHSDDKSQYIQCQVCGSWLKHEISFKRHMKLHIQTNKKFICNICGKEAPNRGALRSHEKYVHLDQNRFKCTICDRAFKRELNLKEHMTTHTGDILYSCTFCPKTFNSSANMHAHRKKIHPVEWEEGRRRNFS